MMATLGDSVDHFHRESTELVTGQEVFRDISDLPPHNIRLYRIINIHGWCDGCHGSLRRFSSCCHPWLVSLRCWIRYVASYQATVGSTNLLQVLDPCSGRQ